MQAGDGRPSYDELAALVVEQARVIAELRTRVAALEAENAEWKRRLGMDSTNSSKPPSSDSPFAKPTPRSRRRGRYVARVVVSRVGSLVIRGRR